MIENKSLSHINSRYAHWWKFYKSEFVELSHLWPSSKNLKCWNRATSAERRKSQSTQYTHLSSPPFSMLPLVGNSTWRHVRGGHARAGPWHWGGRSHFAVYRRSRDDCFAVPDNIRPKQHGVWLIFIYAHIVDIRNLELFILHKNI